MTNEEAVKIIQTELECIKRNDGTDCDRNCAKCDLVMEDTDIKEALGMAIKALSQSEIIQCKDYEQADISMRMVKETPTIQQSTCDGCKFLPRFCSEQPCVTCSNNYENKWRKENR